MRKLGSIIVFSLAFFFLRISVVSAACQTGGTVCQEPRFWCATSLCCDSLNDSECVAALGGQSGGNTNTAGTTGGVGSFLDTLDSEIFSQGRPAGIDTPRGFISILLPYLFTLGGLILFVMLLWGGFEMLTGAANPKSQEAGKQRITAAVIGFFLLFASYWFAQLLEVIFGISIL